MYETVLTIHSWIRWFALVTAFGATLAAVRNQVQGDRSLADRWGMMLMMALDTQLLIGLILYLAVSPNMEQIRSNFPAAMKDPVSRFWAVEHITIMFGAVFLTHIGRVLARKAKEATSKRTRLMLCFGLTTILLLIGIPWPGMRAGRPLLRPIP
jgi:Kef-type K+ transport system membrane component KefB